MRKFDKSKATVGDVLNMALLAIGKSAQKGDYRKARTFCVKLNRLLKHCQKEDAKGGAA